MIWFSVLLLIFWKPIYWSARWLIYYYKHREFENPWNEPILKWFKALWSIVSP